MLGCDNKQRGDGQLVSDAEQVSACKGSSRLNRQPCKAPGVHGSRPRLLLVLLQKFRVIFNYLCTPNLTPANILHHWLDTQWQLYIQLQVL